MTVEDEGAREPAGWQWRMRVKLKTGWADWCEWREGRANVSSMKTEVAEYEERPVYATPAAALSMRKPSEAEVEAALAEFNRWDDGYISGRGGVWNKVYQVYRKNDTGGFDLVSEHSTADECMVALRIARMRAALQAAQEVGK